MTFRFFLGGHDLEMQEIAALIKGALGASALCDKALAWGAQLSHYRDEIEQAVQAGIIPVSVELADDMPADWPVRKQLRQIDHHGARKDEPSSLRQVFELLGLPETQWTWHFQLVAANDTAHVAGMRAMGASIDELRAVRAADRRAQGVSHQEELDGLAGLKAAEFGLNGKVRIVRIPHDRSATVMDPLALEPDFSSGPQDVILLGAHTLQVFGPRNWIDRLAETYPAGWSGGGGSHGFFGVASKPGAALFNEVLRTIQNCADVST